MTLFASGTATQDGMKWIFVFCIVAGFLVELWKRLDKAID